MWLILPVLSTFPFIGAYSSVDIYATVWLELLHGLSLGMLQM